MPNDNDKKANQGLNLMVRGFQAVGMKDIPVLIR